MAFIYGYKDTDGSWKIKQNSNNIPTEYTTNQAALDAAVSDGKDYSKVKVFEEDDFTINVTW